MKKRKYGWSVLGILGLIYTPLGLFFVVLGLLLYLLASHRIGDEPIAFLASFGGVGSIFLIIGLIFLSRDLRRRAMQRRLYEGGYFVKAKITGLRTVSSVKINHEHPVAVVCTYTDPRTGEERTFESREISPRAAEKITASEIPVYLDRWESGPGFVDVDAVLEWSVAVRREKSICWKFGC